jgi:predicted transposase/invertase (TIGR01784 family)
MRLQLCYIHTHKGSVHVTKLKYTFMNDTLFKMLFVKYPSLLKRLVAELLGIRIESIGQFNITNPEMPPESMGDKFCRLDINMVVDGERVDLEIQVDDEGDYPERSLYYWAHEYSTALVEGKDYKGIPRTVIISIVAFKMFDCKDYHSEYQALEVTRHTKLTDKQCLHYFELPKLPVVVNADDELKLWLMLFRAKTEEEMNKIEALGVPVMEEAIEAYRHITTTEEFKEMERLRSLARHNEASALRHAAEVERKKWQVVVKNKDAVIADKESVIADKDAVIADKESVIVDKEAVIAELRARLGMDK